MSINIAMTSFDSTNEHNYIYIYINIYIYIIIEYRLYNIVEGNWCSFSPRPRKQRMMYVWYTCA